MQHWLLLQNYGANTDTIAAFEAGQIYSASVLIEGSVRAAYKDLENRFLQQLRDNRLRPGESIPRDEIAPWVLWGAEGGGRPGICLKREKRGDKGGIGVSCLLRDRDERPVWCYIGWLGDSEVDGDEAGHSPPPDLFKAFEDHTAGLALRPKPDSEIPGFYMLILYHVGSNNYSGQVVDCSVGGEFHLYPFGNNGFSEKSLDYIKPHWDKP